MTTAVQRKGIESRGLTQRRYSLTPSALPLPLVLLAVGRVRVSSLCTRVRVLCMEKEVQGRRGPLGSRSDPLCGKGCKDDRDVASMALHVVLNVYTYVVRVGGGVLHVIRLD